MAVSFSNQSLQAPSCLSGSFFSKNFPKTLETKTPYSFHSFPHTTRLCKPIIGFPPSNSTPIIRTNCSKRSSFKARLAAEDSATTVNDIKANYKNDAKASENKADQKHLSDLKNLIEIYKEAILHGDEKTVSDIEAKINIIERNKEAILSGDEKTVSDIEAKLIILERKNQELVQKVSTLSAEIISGKHKYVRLQADFDNFRKRSEGEKLNIRSDGQGEVIESLLPMVDSFERARQHIKPETEKEKKIDASYQGIYKQFVEIMRSLRVAAVPTVGKPFDPAVHEAIAREVSHEYKEGIIIQEVRRGFLHGHRLLRPATVKVSAGPGSKKAAVDADKQAEEKAVDTEKHAAEPAAVGEDER